nr:hypothetical protein [Tanacetum cinerariifolium]
MVNTRTNAELSVAVQNALQTLLPQIRTEIREEFRTGFRPLDSGGNPPPISHMEKIFDVMGCEDEFKTRLAVYKFEGNAHAWWKAYKQAKGGNVWLITVTWAEFKKLFFLQFFPRAEQERLKREYHSIRQTDTETSTEFMQRFLRLAGFLGAAAGTAEEQAKNFQGVFAGLPLTTPCVFRLRMWLRLPMLLVTMRSSMRGMMMALSDQTRERLAGIASPDSRRELLGP